MADASMPVVGVPCYSAERAGSGRPLFGNNQAYVRALISAGIAPLLIPPMDEEALAAVFARLDGLLLSGGEDIEPERYGEARKEYCGPSEPERDAMELALTHIALERDAPVFGICRGAQTLAVARGGTLYQDILAQRPESRKHAMSDLPRATRTHEVTVEDGSRLAAIAGERRLAVNSLHHQAIRDPGAGAQVVAWADDGVIEAIELPEYRFALAVQYHPEELIDTDEASGRLFAAFAQACRERAASSGR